MTARDILAQVELASGLGLIRDAVTIANDASASLSQKVALFGASAVMTPQDRERLDGLLAAVEAQHGPREAVSLPPGSVADRSMEVATSSGPFALNGHHRNSQNGSNRSQLRSPLVSGIAPEASGRTWTRDDYAARDARLRFLLGSWSTDRPRLHSGDDRGPCTTGHAESADRQ